MQKTTVFHEDVFSEYFRPFRHPLARFGDIWGGHGLETWGDDLPLAFNYDSDYVWTVVEAGKAPASGSLPAFIASIALAFC